MLAGGPDVCADVTFTASDELVCGGQVAPILELEDGAADLGSAGFGPFLAGTPVYAVVENLDGVAAPALPGGWATGTSGGPLPAW